MNEMIMVPAEHLGDLGKLPACPSCTTGSLFPFKVEIDLGGFGGMSHGVGWGVRCFGREHAASCGFTMPITPVSDDGLANILDFFERASAIRRSKS